MNTYQEEEYRGYTIRICYDEDCENPRTWGDGWLTKIICWHRRYSLGDKHDWSDDLAFLNHLARQHSDDDDVRAYLFAHKGDCWAEFREWTPEEIAEYDPETKGQFILHDGQGCYNDREFEEDEMEQLIYVSFDYMTERDLYNLIKKSETVVISPVSIYDHSGVTIYMGGRCCAWDSCSVGYIYQTKAITIKENGGTEENWRDVAWKNMEAELKEYDAWMRGECFGYQVEDEDGDDVESCWGFVGDCCIPEMIAECKSIVDGQIMHRQAQHANRIALITEDFDLLPDEWMYLHYSGAFRIDRNNLFKTKQLSFAKANNNVCQAFAQFPNIADLPEDVLEAMEKTIKQLKAA